MREKLQNCNHWFGEKFQFHCNIILIMAKGFFLRKIGIFGGDNPGLAPMGRDENVLLEKKEKVDFPIGPCYNIRTRCCGFCRSFWIVSQGRHKLFIFVSKKVHKCRRMGAHSFLFTPLGSE